MNHTDSFLLSTRPTVVGTGLVALDVVLTGDDDAPRFFAGGTCGNVLTILAWLGWDAFPVARLGADDAGRRVAADLKRFAVRLEVARLKPRAATPIIIERLRTSADGRFHHQFSLNCPVCGSWLPRYQPVTVDSAKRALNHIPRTSVFFFDRPSRGALFLAKSYAETGSLVVFEPSGRSDEAQLSEALSIAHICKYSSEQFDSFRWKPGHQPLLEIQTLGEAGFRYRHNLGKPHHDRWQTVSALRLGEVRDAAGAGDWFSAGLIHQLAQSGTAAFRATSDAHFESAFDFAKALAAWNCQFEGARGGMYAVSPTEFREQIRSAMNGQHAVFNVPARAPIARHRSFRCPVLACRVRSR